MEKIVMASNNRHKIGELASFLAALCPLAKDGEPYALLSLDDIGYTTEIVEDGETFEANALIKARTVAALGYIGIADDSGLCIDALGGEPGVYSARWAGGHDDADNNRKLVEKMKHVPQSERAAHFVSAIACVFPDGREIVVRGECPGVIIDAPRGGGGFGYDPYFLYEPLGKTFAEMTAEEKNAVSHRARAMERFAKEFAALTGITGK
ncbi:MAG: RdgB/HAM1 family non-canonical purine NTP pyrophosphatase [Clostridiales bacterium]|nr:RdgB/HAM1 family non-canonical purine NTP pyrophosphatase [Clostridiales bacterium]